MSAVGYLTEAIDWSKALDDAQSIETLQAVVAGWMPYVADAQRIVREMDAADFVRWRVGLAKERKGEWAGDEHSRKFGALMMPDSLMRATILAEQFGVPLGAMLIRLRETKVRA